MVQPENAVQVQDVVKHARSQGLTITVKGGGHSFAGAWSTNEDILLDMRLMNRAHLDMDKRVMTIEGGTLWGDAYKQLVNGRHDGWAVNGGRCPMVGVCRFLLAGGLGPFGRSLGIGCDQVLEMTIVTANGELVTVRRNDPRGLDEGRLFWALCGAGEGILSVWLLR